MSISAIETVVSSSRGAGAPARVGPILLAVDGTADSDLAVRAATDLARSLGQPLHLVYCWLPLNTAFGPAGQPEVDVELAYGEPARELLHVQVDKLNRHGADIAGEHLIMGRVSEEVPALAIALGAQLIVTGSRGLGSIKRLVLGSTSEGVVHSSSTPVLVVPGEGRVWPPDQVLVGDDGSSQAHSAGEVAAVVARATGAELTIASVMPRVGTGDAQGTSRESSSREFADQLSAGHGIAVKSLTLTGSPAAVLLSAAASGATPAMIAVGSRGLGAMDRLTLGSVSTKILRSAHGPVLVSHLAQ